MFKIVSILNGRTSVPETVKLNVSASFKFKRGGALVVLSGKATACTATSAPTFISAQDRTDNTATTLLAYPVTEDLVLEAPVSEDPSSLKIGQKVTITLSGGQAVGVTATTEGGVATIYDLQGANAIGDPILVRFVD